jgi:thioredoxin 1
LAWFKTHYKSKIHGDPNLPKITDIEAEAFDEAIKGSDIPVVLEFWIRSCGFCQKFKPVYEQLPDVYGGRVKFLRMNMMKSIEILRLAEGLGVEQTPTTKVFCKGVEAGEIVGLKTLDEAVDELNAVLQSNEACGS